MVSWSRTADELGNSHGKKLIEIVGNALAEETGGLPKPGETLKFEDEVGSDPPSGGYYDFRDPLTAYSKAKSKLAELKKKTEEKGILTYFEFEPATGGAIKVEITGGKPWKSKRTCSITVRNYSVNEDLLFKKIDALEEERHLKEIAEVAGSDKTELVYSTMPVVGQQDDNRKIDGKAKFVYSMMAELLTYGPGLIRPTNTEKLFGLGDDSTYTDLHAMLYAEFGKRQKEIEDSMPAKLAGSRCHLLQWVGSSLVGQETKKLNEWKKTKETQIDALRGKFSCGYKAMDNAIKIEGGSSGPVYHIPSTTTTA